MTRVVGQAGDAVGNVLVPGVGKVGEIANTDGCARAVELVKKF